MEMTDRELMFCSFLDKELQLWKEQKERNRDEKQKGAKEEPRVIMGAA